MTPRRRDALVESVERHCGGAVRLGPSSHGLLLSYGTSTPDEIRAGVERLRPLLPIGTKRVH